MHRPNLSRALASVAALALLGNRGGPVLMQGHDPLPPGARLVRVHTNRYRPRAANPVKNPKVAKNVQDMHDAWFTRYSTRQVERTEPDPMSITSIKTQHHCHRAVARKIKQGVHA